MSEHSNTSTTPPPPYPPHSFKNHHHLPPFIHGGATTSTAAPIIREYRKGNWTLEETLVLITAKKLDDERRVNAGATTATVNSRAVAGGEPRWKWVENYCWTNGCLRSQNQCNDKWDNLLRDYKKVREYELRSPSDNLPSYWSIDKTHRKDRSLPSNLALNIYEALNDVVQKKLPLKHPHHHPLPVPPRPPPPPPPPPPLPEAHHPPPSETSGESSKTNGDESEAKRRKLKDIGSNIRHCTTVLAQTLKSFEENKEKLHRELMELEQQKLRLQEKQNEINRQGIASLITSVEKLSGAIHALISEKHEKP